MDDKVVELHRALVSQISQPLDYLINGQFTESTKGEVHLTGVDHETFSRFGVWLYTRKYLAADPTPRTGVAAPSEIVDVDLVTNSDESKTREARSRTNSEPSPQAQQAEVGDSWSQYTGSTQDAETDEDEEEEEEEKERQFIANWSKQKSRRVSFVLKKRLLELYPIEGTVAAAIHQPAVNLSNLDYTETLLSHARQYVFADQWQIGELKQEALTQLAEVLVHYFLWEECIGDVVSLTRFVYENTVTRSEDGCDRDPLRELVLRYIDTELDALTAATAFKDLMAEKRELFNDVMLCVQERLQNAALQGSDEDNEDEEQEEFK